MNSRDSTQRLCFTTYVVTTMKSPTSSRLCTIWLFAHDLLSRHKREDFITTTQTAVSTITWPSFHTDRTDRAAVSPTTLAAFAPASHTSSTSVCRFHAPANHTSSIRIPRSSPDLGYPAWCSSSFHLTSPRSILVGLLLLTAVI